jgi:S-adenosylmethionine uptake transporter
VAHDPQAPIPAIGTPQTPQRDGLKGVVFMLAGFFFYSMSDALAKLLTEDFPSLQVAWFRQLGLLVGVVVLLALHGGKILRTRHPFVQFGRGFAAVITVSAFVTAVTYVPLADAVAVSFVAPFILTILAALVLGEYVGIRRWVAVSLGFVGTLIVIRPGFGIFHPAIFLVLVAAVGFAIRQILSRYLSGDDTTATTVAYTGLTASILLTFTLPFDWVTPESWHSFALIAVMAAVAGIGEFLIIRALEMTQAVILAPLMYSLMIWSTLWGFLLFADLPDRWTLLGTMIIVGSGLYALYRESRANKR